MPVFPATEIEHNHESHLDHNVIPIERNLP